MASIPATLLNSVTKSAITSPVIASPTTEARNTLSEGDTRHPKTSLVNMAQVAKAAIREIKMTDESAVAKLNKDLAEKEKGYKTTHDVERVQRLISAAHLMRDYPRVAALANSLTRELHALSLKQEELDAAEKEELAKAMAEARAADDKMYAEQNAPKEVEENPPKTEGNPENPGHPTSAPHAPRRFSTGDANG